ncbi:MAG: hypothetical protein ACE5JR_04530 [Gemmatimonadota bacterium]
MNRRLQPFAHVFLLLIALAFFAWLAREILAAVAIAVLFVIVPAALGLGIVWVARHIIERRKR